MGHYHTTKTSLRTRICPHKSASTEVSMVITSTKGPFPLASYKSGELYSLSVQNQVLLIHSP